MVSSCSTKGTVQSLVLLPNECAILLLHHPALPLMPVENPSTLAQGQQPRLAKLWSSSADSRPHPRMMQPASVTFPDGTVLRTRIDRAHLEQQMHGINVKDPRVLDLVYDGLWDSELPEKHITTSWQAEQTRKAKNWIMLVRRSVFDQRIVHLIQQFFGDPTEAGTIANPMSTCIRYRSQILHDALFHALKQQCLSCAWTIYAPPMSDKRKSHELVAGYLWSMWCRI